MRELRHPRGFWALALEPDRGIVFLGLDSEGTGREKSNLLLEPPKLSWAGSAGGEREGAEISVDAEGEGFRLGVTNTGRVAREAFGIELPMNALMAAAVLIPSGIDRDHRGLGPWLLVAPDFGHLVVRADCPVPVVAENDGVRGYSARNAPMGGVDPGLRGEAWKEAARLPEYRPGRLALRFLATRPVQPGETVALRFEPAELAKPAGIGDTVWRRIRRPYLNHWQPCGTWAGPSLVNILANNVLSDPASCSLHFYTEPAIFWHEPVPGVDVRHLVRRSLDHWLDNAVSAQGHVNAFGSMYDLYTFTGTSLLVAAWHYWKIAGDREWLHRRVGEGPAPVLHRMADWLVRRDVDGDGLIESLNSGNAGTLRDPDRADIWYEMMNFGWKNAWTNARAHLAFLCLAEMMEEDGLDAGAAYYRGLADRLRAAFARRFLGRNGWFVSWVSLDGEVHDWCHTFVNGAAVAYGLVPPQQGREILERVVLKSRSIGFTRWDLGVPGNLAPCALGDLIGPRIGPDGRSRPADLRHRGRRVLEGIPVRLPIPQRHRASRAGVAVSARPAGGGTRRRSGPDPRGDDRVRGAGPVPERDREHGLRRRRALHPRRPDPRLRRLPPREL